ncbi:hypothetical protein P691DRAFT_811886 [Macrolepiota fuliginosa MF-IS2]|uniref:Uncharacterized protein n=1 Tax=Macrolepiota fuliginosa MF-IS2 TaxID=1400762 RepID=A0A9P5X0C7_9AGAR|nr:hypothetical protein P691DRAFT_811886 [Macrolepiota fuliginosa MF-IS2]
MRGVAALANPGISPCGPAVSTWHHPTLYDPLPLHTDSMHIPIFHTSKYARYVPSCIHGRLARLSPILFALTITRPDGRLWLATLR